VSQSYDASFNTMHININTNMIVNINISTNTTLILILISKLTKHRTQNT
jgi:hypothetical protein